MTRTTSQPPPVTGGVVARSSWRQLLNDVAAFFAGAADPFVTDTLIVPSAAHGRYVAQHLGRALGICAGINMMTPSQFTRAVLSAEHDQSWTQESLAVAITDTLASMPDLLRPGATPSLAYGDALARMFTGYLRRCPAMLLAWEDGHDTGPDGTALDTRRWQPALWRELATRLGPHPARQRLQAASRLADVPGRLAALLTTPPWPIDRPLFDALAAAGAPVWTLQVSQSSRSDPAWPDSLVAAELEPAFAPAPVQVHLSHGPSRQVEVLRDVLCAAFDELPGLQPRDVLVLTTDSGTYEPLLAAAFAPDVAHPAGGLRLRPVFERMNPLVDGLMSILLLDSQRGSGDDLMAWYRRPEVAKLFGLSADDRLRLDDLVRTSVVWGIDKTVRDSAGVDVRTGTWLDAVQRMTLALVTSTPSGNAVPLAGVESDDADLIGALAELISRLRRARAVVSTPASLAQWADRLAQAAQDLFSADDWAQERLNALLSDWRANDSATPLTRTEVALLLRRHRLVPGRPAFGSGNLTVARLGELQGIEFSVICVLGLDDQTFPAPLLAQADDMLFDMPGDDPRRRSRVALRDAWRSARDRFIVVTRGADERTGASLPPPVAVLDILQVARDDVLRRHTLQPYAWPNFAVIDDRAPFSYDAASLKAAQRLSQPAVADAPGWRQFGGEPAMSGQVGLDEVERFLRDPAQFLLRQACNLVLASHDEGDESELPLAFTPLGRWAAGQELLEDLLAQVPPADARAKAQARRDAPPGALGRAGVDRLAGQVLRQSQRILALGTPDVVPIDLALGSLRLTGAVPLRGCHVVVQRFGAVKAAQVLACWVRLLAVALTEPRSGLVGDVWASDKHLVLAPPPTDQAWQLLSWIVRQARLGAGRLIPLPADAGAAWAGVLGRRSGRRNPEAAAEAEFAGKYGEGRQAPWLMLLGEPTLAALRASGDFNALATRLWQPIGAAMREAPP